MTNRFYELAKTYEGTKEIPGEADNPVIVDLAATVGDEWVKDDETAWCGAFVGAMFVKSGVLTKEQVREQTNGNPLGARNWLKVGTPVDSPREGDLAIFWRGSPDGWQGHVGFYVGTLRNGDIQVLGGNQSNSVSIATYKGERLLGFRRVEEVTQRPTARPEAPEQESRTGILLKILRWLIGLFR